MQGGDGQGARHTVNPIQLIHLRKQSSTYKKYTVWYYCATGGRQAAPPAVAEGRSSLTCAALATPIIASAPMPPCSLRSDLLFRPDRSVSSPLDDRSPWRAGNSTWSRSSAPSPTTPRRCHCKCGRSHSTAPCSPCCPCSPPFPPSLSFPFFFPFFPFFLFLLLGAPLRPPHPWRRCRSIRGGAVASPAFGAAPLFPLSHFARRPHCSLLSCFHLKWIHPSLTISRSPPLHSTTHPHPSPPRAPLLPPSHPQAPRPGPLPAGDADHVRCVARPHANGPW